MGFFKFLFSGLASEGFRGFLPRLLFLKDGSVAWVNFAGDVNGWPQKMHVYSPPSSGWAGLSFPHLELGHLMYSVLDILLIIEECYGKRILMAGRICQWS